MSQSKDLASQTSNCVQNSQTPASKDGERDQLQSTSTLSEDQNVDVDLPTSSQSIVDELFKDYISKKNMQLASDVILHKKNIESASVEEMNAILDREISIINTGTNSKNIEVKHKTKHKKKRKSESHESKHVSKKKKNYQAQFEEEMDKSSSKSGDSEEIFKSDLSSSKLHVGQKSDSNNGVELKSDLELLCTYSKSKEYSSSDKKMIVPIPDTIDSQNHYDISSKQQSLLKKAEEKHTVDDDSVILPIVKPKALPNKSVNISLKISSDSAQFIASGDIVDKKGKRREEGEVVTSGSETNGDSNYEDDDDDVRGSKISDTGSLPESGDDKSHSKSHKKKKHKHKRKKKKKSKNKDKSEDGYKESKKSHERRDSLKQTEREGKYRKHNRSRSRSNSRSRSKTRPESYEVYDRGWDARSYSDDVKGQKNSSYTRDGRDKHDRRHNSHSRSRSRSRSRPRSRTKTRWRSRSRSRSRGRSRSKSENKKLDEDLRLKIDKKKLRKIAMANVLATMRGVNSSDIVNIKSGGKSVAELTDFCKGLAGKDEDYTSSEIDSDDNVTERDVDQPFIHHPFVVRDQPPIIMNIRNAKQLPVMTQSEKTVSALRSQFPVSSGNQHRLKELEWVPVEKSTASTPASSTESVTVAKTFSLPAPVTTGTSILPPVTSAPSISQTPQVISDPVFPQPVSIPIDIGAIVSERLQAVRKLQENPFDVQALSKMHKSQEKASQWAQSQFQPGQFTGSTGVQILTKSELEGTNKKNQAWLKKDQFKRAEPVKSGIGMFLLQKMGWKAGEGLGKNNEGSLEPLLLDLKVDRKGLQTQNEVKGNVKGVPKIIKSKGGNTGPVVPMPVAGQNCQTLPKDLSGKHPVSALLELCNRRKYGAPYFELVHESGPDHKKNFLFKVLVNHVEYQPSITSNNKKTAKAQAATVCLQELGMLPRTGPI